MSIGNALTVTSGALRKNKLQTALTMTGMMVGVGTVLTMIALGSGAQAAIQDQVRAAGMNLLVVTAGNYSSKLELRTADGVEGPSASVLPMPAPGRDEGEAPVLLDAAWNPSMRPRLMKVQENITADPSVSVLERGEGQPRLVPRIGDTAAGRGAATTLSMADADAIAQLEGVQFVSAGIRDNANAQYGSGTQFTALRGSTSSLSSIRRAWVFPRGRFFNDKEERDGENVAVLGRIAYDSLFGKTDAIGKTILLRGEPFKVIGVIDSGSWMVQPAAGDDQFDAIYVPVTVMQRMLRRSYLDTITVTTRSTGDVTKVSKLITALLRSRHGVKTEEPDDFSVNSEARKVLSKGGMRPEVAHAVVGNVGNFEKVTLEQLGKTLDQASATMSALLICIATVSLVVGGIGIMNVMLLSVTQRIREIGIRRAVGARSGDVLKQFLLEAIMLSLAGGLAGIALGCVAAQSLSSAVKWSTQISWTSVLISFAISAVIGIFFGYYPAKQASRVHPMESLRYE